ncbi:MAG: endonuclease/exonuclease/phosphatase family protein [Chloroflexota bacterium]
MKSFYHRRSQVLGLLVVINLVLMTFATASGGKAQASEKEAYAPLASVAVFISEIHYDNTGGDVDEGIEIAGPAGTDLSGWQLVPYNGNGGASYTPIVNLTGTIPDQQNGYGTLWFALTGLQNGAPDGIALVNASSAVVQFLSYEGSFTATNGVASGITSVDIGVAEAGTEAVGQSLQLCGAGTLYQEFTWTAPSAHSRSLVNSCQSFGTQVFINEIHYDDGGADANEGIEVAGPAGTDLSGWQLVPYNGNGGVTYTPIINLTGTIPNQQNGYGTLWYDLVGLQNGAPDGIALVAPGDVVVQFLSYEGSFAATNGPANGMTSTNIGVSETGSEADGLSLQLCGIGMFYEEFTWTGPSTHSRGLVNSCQTFPTTIFINEIHYDDGGADANEGIEVAGPAGTDLSGWQLVPYNGNGGVTYTPIINLTGTIPNQQNGYGTLWYDLVGLQNGSPDGIALVDASSNVVQFLSYEGSFTATNGVAAGKTSVDIGVSEAGSEPDGLSLQLCGTGTVYEEFIWTAPSVHSRGLVNSCQTFGDIVADLIVTKTGPEDVLVGEDMVYEISLENTAGVAADDVELTDTLPAGVTYVTDDSGYTCTGCSMGGAGPLVWTVGSVAAGTTVTFNLTVHVDSGVSDGTLLTNLAEFTTSLPGDDPDTNTSEAETTAHQITPIHDIQFVVDPEANDASPLAGQWVYVEGIVTAEPGDLDSSSRVMIIEDPAGGPYSGLQLYASTGNFSTLSAPPGTEVRAFGRVYEYYGLTELQVDGATNVTVLSTGNPVPGPDVVTTHDFATGNAAVAEGWESVFIEFHDAIVTDENLGYGNWAFDDGTGPTRGDDMGASGNPLTYEPTLGDEYVFIRGIGFYDFDDYKIEPRSDADIKLRVYAPKISKAADTLVAPGGVLDYTITVKNDFDYALTSVVITDVVPAGTTFAYALDSGSESGGIVTWNVASLAPYASVDVHFGVAAPGAAGWIDNDTYAVKASNFVTSTFGTPLPTLVDTAMHIRDIQGAGHYSIFTGRAVTGVQGVITAVRSTSFYMQDPNPDADDATSEGILVYVGSAHGRSVGDLVSVDATVFEYYQDGPASGNLSVTEIRFPTAITLISSGNPLPAPVVIGIGGRLQPTQVIEDDVFGTVEDDGVFDPSLDGIDFYESMEGMLVQVNDALVVGSTMDYSSGKEITVVPDQGANAALLSPRGSIVIRPDDYNPERIIVTDVLYGSTPFLDSGAQFTGPIIGVIDYSYRNFKLFNTVALPPYSDNLEAETTSLTPTSEQLTVATYNVENLDPGDPDTKFAAHAQQIVVNLGAPDIIGVEEIQDNNGETDDGTVAANLTFGKLIQAILDAGGPQYAYRSVDPLDNMDGGAPGGNIRVGFMFRTDRGLAFVDRPGGDAVTATAAVPGLSGVELTLSPGRINPTHTAFDDSRKPVVGEFVFLGRKLFVIANHLNSKGGDQPLFGRFQPPVLASEVQRLQQAQVVNDFVDSILALDPSALVMVVGDLNDFQFSAPLDVLKGGVLTDLHGLLPENERYTYSYEGNMQALDHILVSEALLTMGVDVDVVHVNAEFDDKQRATDHDPVLALIDLPQTWSSYELDDDPGPEWSKTTMTTSPCGTYFLGEFGQETVTLSLSELPPHSWVRVVFDLFIIRSWDGNNAQNGPDIWQLGIDGNPLLHTTFSNIKHPTYSQAFPGEYPGSVYAAQTGAVAVNTLCYQYNGVTMDATYHLMHDMQHTGNTIQIDFSGLQLGSISTESWGLDNVEVYLLSDTIYPYHFYLPLATR